MEATSTYVFDAKIAEPSKKKKSKWKTILSIVFLFVNILIVAYIAYSAFKGQGNVFDATSVVFQTWGKNWKYLLAGSGCFFMAVFCEILKYYLLVHHKTGIWNFRLAVRTVIMGKYYDNITPLASGGEVFQVYYLNKDGVPLGTATTLPFISFALNQLALSVLTVATFIWIRYNPLSQSSAVLSAFKVAAIVGLILSLAMPLTIVGIMIMPKATKKFFNWIGRLVCKLKFIRNPQRIAGKIDKTLNDYQYSMTQFKKSGLVLMICFLLGFVYKIMFMSMPYFVIKACGVNANYLEMFSLTIIITVAVSFIPTPGNAGAAELSFNSIFVSYLPKTYMFWGMLYWRFCCYYLWIICGVIMLIILTFKHKRKKAYITEPLINTLNEVTPKEFYVLDFDGAKHIFNVNPQRAKTFIDSSLIHCIVSEKGMSFISGQDFSALTQDTYIEIQKEVIDEIKASIGVDSFAEIGFVSDDVINENVKLLIDTGRETTPLDAEKPVIESSQFSDLFYPYTNNVVLTVDAYGKYLTKNGINTAIYVPSVPGYKEKQYEYVLNRTPSINWAGTSMRRPLPRISTRIKRKLEPNGLTMFHSHTPYTMNAYGLRMARRYDVPILVSFHNDLYDDLLLRFKHKIIAKGHLKEIISTCSHCDGVWVENDRASNIIREYGYKGDITIMPSGTDWVIPSKTNTKKIVNETINKLGMNKNDLRLLYAGKLVWTCNLKFLIDSLKLLDTPDHNNLQIIFAGSGQHKHAIMKYVEDMKFVHLKVIFTKKMKEEEYKNIVLTSDLLLMPSTYDFAPAIIKDGAAYHKAAVVIENSCAATDIKDLYNGFVAKNDVLSYANKIIEAISDADRLKAIGDNAGITLPISWGEVSKMIYEEYLKVIRKYYEGK